MKRMSKEVFDNTPENNGDYKSKNMWKDISFARRMHCYKRETNKNVIYQAKREYDQEGRFAGASLVKITKDGMSVIETVSVRDIMDPDPEVREESVNSLIFKCFVYIDSVLDVLLGTT